jgi:N-carbamoyl-L-amino-acid hydrolase
MRLARRLVAAAEVVTGVRKIGRIAGDLRPLSATHAHPNIVNAIRQVTPDRHARSPTTLDRALPMLDAVVNAACGREGVRHELEHYWRVPRTPFDRAVVATVERAAQAAGARHRRILSGAGHDAQYMAAIGPTGMIFVPSRGGRSHCEEEFTPMDDIEHGATTLFLAVLDLAGGGTP